MDSFAKYTIIDWIAFLQVLLIWFYMAYRSGQWIVSVACSKGWRWWNRKNKKALALDSFYEAFNLNSLQPGSVVVVTTQKRHDDTNSQAKGGKMMWPICVNCGRMCLSGWCRKCDKCTKQRQ